MRRGIKVALGILVAGGATYAIAGEQLAGTSADATINAQLVTLRAPIDGELTLAVRGLGTQIGANEQVAAITDPRPEETRLLDLQRSAMEVESDRDRLSQLFTRLSESRASLQRQLDDFLSGRFRQLEARLAESRAAQEASEARLRETEDTLRRAADLSSRGVQTPLDLGRARAGAEVARQDVEVARSRTRTLAADLDAAMRGVFLGDAYNDTPQTHQRIRDIDIEIGRLDAEIQERSRRLKALRDRIDEERVRAGRAREARLTSKGPSLLWEIAATSGEFVRRGQDIVRLVDCSTAIVTASVSETVYNGLRVGDAVQFRLLGAAPPTSVR
ncbi:HlyD family efflux transporter periplasmic adaptor subunit [Belnapia rosea]|uniref:HlyD family efflux transporter periplasmic adaptor subunit n=1 Tax=Belnapia rosea TaxID=938405 RepID=UPI0008838177|nr:HlyD family efflux transporter periplasmic adaptor subunit [Belnapia rosea]SDB74746.1 HlyD family secretion protein [Belnapia rosea]